MPGLVGIVRTDDQRASVEAASAKLVHFPWLSSQHYQPSPSLSLGVVYRKERPGDYDWHYDDVRRIGVLVSGKVLCSRPEPHVVSASEILEEYASRGFDHWPELEGVFAAAILDLSQNRLHIANDRFGQLPLYYARNGSVFAFSPEAKGILVHGEFEPKLSEQGIVTFLTVGYCYGSSTLFDGISYLEPCTLLTVDLTTLEVEKKRLWKIVYEPSRDLSKRSRAEEALHVSTLAGHRVAIADKPRRIGLLLSGGWDSRGIMAVLDRIGRPLDYAQSWGLRDDIPGSDAFLAHQLADLYGVPFVFNRYDTDTFVANAEQWCYISELANDNYGWYAEGAGMFTMGYDRATDVLFTGDENWGGQGLATTELEARANVLLPPAAAPDVRRILRKDLVQRALDYYEDAIQSIIRHCDNTEPDDRKDFFYIHGRVARYIMSLGYYRELVTPLRRPYLSNATVDLVRQLHRKHRLWKNLYVTMMQRFYPKVSAIPTNRSSSLPDWQFNILREGALRDYVLSLLDFDRIKNGKLGEMVDRGSLEELRGRIFSRPPTPSLRVFSKRDELRGRITSRAARSVRLSWILRKMGPSPGQTYPHAGPMMILRRLALLSLLQGILKDLADAHVRAPEAKG